MTAIPSCLGALLAGSAVRLNGALLAGTAPELPSRRAVLTEYVLYFLLVSLVVALVASAIRLREPGRILRETTRFFVTIVVGIFLFSLVVFALEWLFIRPLIQ